MQVEGENAQVCIANDNVRLVNASPIRTGATPLFIRGGVLGTAVVLSGCCEGRGGLRGKLGGETETLASLTGGPQRPGLIDFFHERGRGCPRIPKFLFVSRSQPSLSVACQNLRPDLLGGPCDTIVRGIGIDFSRGMRELFL